MDWNNAINRHRKQLAHIVATLFAMIGLVEGAPVERVSKPLYRAVLRLLRPAESAVRRLIVAAAQGLVVKPPKPRPAPAKPIIIARKGQGQRRITFKLFDPRQRFTSAFAFERPRRYVRPVPVQWRMPRIRVLDGGFDPRSPLFRNTAPAPPPPPPPEPAPPPDDTVSAVRLCRRLAAIQSALEDLPRQARRYARWQARPAETRRPQLDSALRPGRPPGHRKRPTHKVDEILNECDWLARRPLQPDTS